MFRFIYLGEVPLQLALGGAADTVDAVELLLEEGGVEDGLVEALALAVGVGELVCHALEHLLLVGDVVHHAVVGVVPLEHVHHAAPGISQT